ncbi:hypothetical protein SAMN06265360_107192 [Haloechinothrix alba]|uniref:Uncharacterized protein n=1 Tax=Haloechinothrix alba TaxID=664784 RepID=A0A238WTN9_9PSEU|nr:hypothetical protein [Haloechinothrix alba]SNR49711.1 hypothetical protein SAMN06265360_107192 [Haloechinothrix alba]
MRTEKGPRRGSGGGKVHEGSGTTCEYTAATDTPAQLRARRAASYRFPPMECGHRDPVDCYPRPRDINAARLAWWHLREHGLLSEHVEAVLAEEVV